jgi:small-conductance mechanosensitive channel
VAGDERVSLSTPGGGLEGLLWSAGILLASYLGARFLSFLLGRTLARAARRTARPLDDRAITGLQRPLTYALFLLGAYAAVHRMPAPGAWTDRLDQALYALAVVLVSLALIRAYGILLDWYSTESRRGEVLATEFGPLLSKLGRLLILVLGLIAVLNHFEVNVQSLVVSLGVGSLALGLAAQDTLANMFAGFTLMLDRPFKIGDRIQLATGEVGDVETIGMRATQIRTLDETFLIVPNSSLTKERLVNLSRPSRSITTRMEVGLAYGTDLAQAKRILREAALSSEYIDQERAPQVLVSRFADFSVNFQLVFWARDYTQQGLARSQVHEEAYRLLRGAGIEIPVPVRRIIGETAR